MLLKHRDDSPKQKALSTLEKEGNECLNGEIQGAGCIRLLRRRRGERAARE
jgi:hypothetical protein